MRDRIAPLQLRPPIPVQQRAAVGEVAIPIARVTTSIAKLVPIAGELVVLAEVATGRSMLGLGEKLSNAERALDAALLIAPRAAEALGSGVRGAAELLRLSRATGRSVEEVRVVCRVAVTVQANRVALREGIATAQSGKVLTTAERTALDAVARSAESLPESQALRRRAYTPTLTHDGSLPTGEGWTDKYGNMAVSPHGTAKDVALTTAHESVHSFLSPRALDGLREIRADARMAAYKKSDLCRYLEEALAESYAQVKVNGLRGLPEGLAFPISKRLRVARARRSGRRDWNGDLCGRSLRGPREGEPAVTISAEEALDRARRHAEERGWPWREPVTVTRRRAFVVLGRVTYEVWSSSDRKGSNARVIVAADDGSIVEAHWLPR